MPSLVVVGDIVADIVVRGVRDVTFGDIETLAGDTRVLLGGCAANSASIAERLGVTTEIIAVMGDDQLGQFCRSELQQRGIGLEHVRTVPGGRTGSSVILVRDDNDRFLLTDLGVLADLAPTDFERALALEPDMLLVVPWFLPTRLAPVLPLGLREANARGVVVSVYSHFDHRRKWETGLPESLEWVNVLYGNEVELRGIAAACGLAEADSLVDVAESLLPMLASNGQRPALVVAKQADRGAFAVDVEGRWHATPQPVQVVDTVGAGDTLAGAMSAGLLAGLDVSRALRRAVAAATASTTAAGGTAGHPTMRELDALEAQCTLVRL